MAAEAASVEAAKVRADAGARRAINRARTTQHGTGVMPGDPLIAGGGRGTVQPPSERRALPADVRYAVARSARRAGLIDWKRSLPRVSLMLFNALWART